ncbi:hypothetical protein CTRI78_v006816 [Colletotrichum trifolii]|uniref:Uncharacterized protein n=1 Tax=Colletotrichum trifolii TaxID=5466 RepID=A0A4R8RBD5_COLTR|nr:hypothetical protein CTRI78_v006816 [Colletotrichum trifolii]
MSLDDLIDPDSGGDAYGLGGLSKGKVEAQQDNKEENKKGDYRPALKMDREEPKVPKTDHFIKIESFRKEGPGSGA